MTDLLATVPATYEMASTETLPFSYDASPLLESGETPSAPVVTLVDLATGAAYAAGLPIAPVLAGNVITQRVTALLPGHRYRLAFSFTAAVGKIWSEAVVLTCPF